MNETQTTLFKPWVQRRPDGSSVYMMALPSYLSPEFGALWLLDRAIADGWRPLGKPQTRPMQNDAIEVLGWRVEVRREEDQ